MSSFFRGTTASSDFRFGDKSKATLEKIKSSAPKEYGVKIDMARVCKPIIQGWIGKRVTELLGFEDDVVIGLVQNDLETKQVRLLWLWPLESPCC